MLKILLKAPMSVYSGYGNDGIGIAQALIKSGADVYLQPTHIDAPLPEDVAALLTKRLVAPFDVLIHHVDPGQFGLSPEERRASRLTVAWTMWEYSSLGNLKGRSKLKKALESYDLILGYDSVTTECFQPYINPKISTLKVLQGGFYPEKWPKAERDWFGDRFGFAMCGVLSDRKDPFVSILAFKELKEEFPEEFDGAELHLKTNAPGLHSAMEEWVPKLRVHYASWPEDVLYQFYAMQHVLLAPSRGEGKNMPALEFQSTGGAVIATNWGGHTGWMSSEYAYPLDYTLAPLDEYPTVFNARASKDHMKQLMLHTYRNRSEVKSKAEVASEVIPQIMNWDYVIDKLYMRLRSVPEIGSEIFQKSLIPRQEVTNVND